MSYRIFNSLTLSDQTCFFQNDPVNEYFSRPSIRQLEGKVDLIICDPPWGVLMDSSRQHVVSCDRVDDEDIKATAAGAKLVLKENTGNM